MLTRGTGLALPPDPRESAFPPTHPTHPRPPPLPRCAPHRSPADLVRPPSLRDVAPMLRNGVLLSARSLLAMSVLMWATKLIAGLGAVCMAAHEILRQIWVLSNQAFTALDIATQSLVAFHLGRGDRAAAAAVFARTLGLAVSAGVLICGLLLANAAALPGVFTNDAAVVRQAVQVREWLGGGWWCAGGAVACVRGACMVGRWRQASSWGGPSSAYGRSSRCSRWAASPATPGGCGAARARWGGCAALRRRRQRRREGARAPSCFAWGHACVALLLLCATLDRRVM